MLAGPFQLFDGRRVRRMAVNVDHPRAETACVPSVDNVQEFKIQSNALMAQYGWASGNIVPAGFRTSVSPYQMTRRPFCDTAEVATFEQFLDGHERRHQPIIADRGPRLHQSPS